MRHDGVPVSIHVDQIGDSLHVQHFVSEVTGPRHCRMVSTSDVFDPDGRTTAEIVWDLSLAPLDDRTCEYINHVTATATDQFLAMIAESEVPFEQMAIARDNAYVAHNEQETRDWPRASSAERSPVRRYTMLHERPGFALPAAVPLALVSA
jgi:hypothetical protein